MSLWKEHRLGELLTIKHGYAFKGEYFAREGSHIVLTPGNFLEEGGFKKKADKEKWYCGEVPGDYVLKRGDLLVPMTEQAEGLLGSAAIVPESDLYLHNQRLGLVQNLDGVSKRFLYYLFNSQQVRQQIRASSSGVKVRHTSPSRIYEVRVSLPNLATQRKIAAILSAYDDLIENNLRRIKILEEMAQNLYQEWFVKFRFPGHENVRFVGSPLGKIPEAWLGSFPDFVDFKEGPGLRKWQYRSEGMPFLNIRTLVDNDIDFSKVQYLDPEEVQTKYQHFMLEEHDHVVSSSGTLGRIVTIQKHHLPLMLNTSVIRMRASSVRVGKWQLKHFLRSDYFQHQILAYAIGAAQPNFGPSHLKLMLIIAPSHEISAIYEEYMEPLEEILGVLVRKNSSLRRTRDLLLPKLISGEVDVSELDITVPKEVEA